MTSRAVAGICSTLVMLFVVALGAIDDHFDVVDPVSSDSGFAADHFLEAGERIVVLCRQWGRRSDTGVRVEWRVAIAGTVEGGRITALEYYPSWEEALDGRYRNPRLRK